jgi:hypothetical protein
MVEVGSCRKRKGKKMAKAKVISKDPSWKPRPGTLSLGVKGWKMDKTSTQVLDESGRPIRTPSAVVECVWTADPNSTTTPPEGKWVCGKCPDGHTPEPEPTGDDMPDGLVILVDCGSK